jgi:hypothetical protein
MLRFAEVVHGSDRLEFVLLPGFTAGDFGFASTAHCPAGTASQTKAYYSGQSLLGDAAAVLVGVEALTYHRPAGHRCWLASSRFQIVLDMAFAA